MHRKPIVIAAMAGLLATAASVDVPDYVDAVFTQLTATVEMNQGVFRQAFIGHVNGGSAVTHRMRTDYGGPMRVFAFCDGDCSDVDLDILRETPNGMAVVVDDVETDAAPIVSFNPVQGGRYHARVKMYDCNEDPCYYGISTFSA